MSVLVLSSCNLRKETEDVVNVYTKRHYQVDKDLFAQFEKIYNIKVNVVKASADELIERIKTEADNCPADLLITVDAGKLYKASSQNLLQKINYSDFPNSIGKKFLDKNGYWLPITYRARLIVYHKDRVNENELSTYSSLVDPKWKGKILVRSSKNAYNQALLSSMIANLGTAYELSGELDSALKYISKGLKINPTSHYGSEWIHVELLKAKIKRKKSKYYIIKNSILSDELLESKRDTTKRYWHRSRVLDQIYRQVRTRAPFTPAPNEVIWNLLLTAGDYAQKYDTYENAFLAFAYSRKYAYNWEQKRKSENRLKTLNKLRDQLPKDKMIDHMFFHTVKRANISPDFLLMGLDELSESLDSINTLENKYLSRIDSLEKELKKPKPQPIVSKKIVQQPKKEQSSNLLFYIVIVSLGLTTVFFALKARRKG